MLIKSIDDMDLRDENLIQIGNFGLNNSDLLVSHELDSLDRLLVKFNTTLYITRGNEDNPKMFASGYKTNFQRIKLISDFSSLQLNDSKVFTFGGGISKDRVKKHYRGEYFSDEKVVSTSIPIETDISIIASFKPEPYIFDELLESYDNYWLSGDMCLENQMRDERDILQKIFKKLKKKNNIKYAISSHIDKSLQKEINGIKYISLSKLEFYKI